MELNKTKTKILKKAATKIHKDLDPFETGKFQKIISYIDG